MTVGSIFSKTIQYSFGSTPENVTAKYCTENASWHSVEGEWLQTSGWGDKEPNLLNGMFDAIPSWGLFDVTGWQLKGTHMQTSCEVEKLLQIGTD